MMPRGGVRISFAPSMVNALIAGTKTETRRLAIAWDRDGRPVNAVWFSVQPGTELPVREPYYREAEKVDPVTGSRLIERACYRADGDLVDAPVYRFLHGRDGGRWFQDVLTRAVLDLPNGSVEWGNPRFMPVWATRLSVTLRDVRRERLMDLTDAGAIAEGATGRESGWSMDWSGIGRMSRRLGRVVTEQDIAAPTPREAFFAYWNYLQAPRDDRFAAPADPNPEMAVVCFTVNRVPHPCWGTPA